MLTPLPETLQVTDSLADTLPRAVSPSSTLPTIEAVFITGAVVSTTVTVLVAVPSLPAASVAE